MPLGVGRNLTQALLMIKCNIPLLNYWLENFNFFLIDEDNFSLLAEAVERSTNAEVCCKFMAALKQEREQEEKEEDDEEDLDDYDLKMDVSLYYVGKSRGF